MTSSDHKPKTVSIEAEAGAWIAQLDGGALSTQDADAFREWCSRSPAHADAVRHAAKMWGAADILSALAEPIRLGTKAEQAQSRPRRTWIKGLSTAVLLLVVTSIGIMQFAPSLDQQNHPEALLMVETLKGEQLVRILSDGSVITLNTDTQIEVDFDSQIRRVRILSGEALFEVAHAPSRPFIVYAEGETIRAVGTAFLVRVTDTEVEVMVTEGVVEYASAPQITVKSTEAILVPISARGRLKAGQSIRLGIPDPIIQPVDRVEISRTLAWTDGVLMFNGETLEEVIEELSRYTDDVIIFDDVQSRQIRIGGVFEIGKTDTLLIALETSFNLTVDRQDSGDIHISYDDN